jgi:DNA-binding MarR family transcriptional regulator
VCHKCDNPNCVNPDHLFVGTQADNVHDCIKKNRRSIGEKHWKARLTEAQVKEIRRVYSSRTHTNVEIASMFGVTPSAIGRIVKRKLWKGVE